MEQREGAEALRRILSVKSIRDISMRRIALGDHLCRGPAEIVVHGLMGLIERGGRRDPETSTVLAALVAALDDDALLSYQRRSDLYRAASELVAYDVARLFLQAEPTSEPHASDDARAPTRAVVPRGRVLSLGERKHLARTHDTKLILHLLRDPHPDVVAILLDNPHMREQDVMVIAAQRPVLGEGLRAIARHPRWSLRPRLRYAIVQNPHAPLPLAFRLVLDLGDRELTELGATPSHPDALRDQARDVLLRRRGVLASSCNT